MARPKGVVEKVQRRPISDEFSNPLQLSDEVLDSCIEIYLNTGNLAAVGRAVGRSRSWALQLFKSDRAIERMKQQTVQLRSNPKVATVEECMSKLSSVMRGDQLVQLADRVKEIVGDEKSDNVAIADAIDKLTRFTPQIEGNQIKAATLLLTAQGAMDPNRSAKEDVQAAVDELILSLSKSEGTVDAILDGIRNSAKLEVIDVTPE